MSLLLFLGYPTARKGGLEICAFRLTSRLARLGDAITAFFNHDGDLLPDYRRFCERVHVLRSPLATARAFGDLWHARNRAAVVYIHHPARIFQMWALSRLVGARLVCHLHLPPQRLSRLAVFGLRRTDLFIAVSEATKAAWRATFDIPEERIAVVPNGVDASAFVPAADPAGAKARFRIAGDVRVVTFVGRLDRQKGADVVIRAFLGYLRSHPDGKAVLLIAGRNVIDDETYEQELKTLAEPGVRAGVIRFLGPVSDTVSLYQASDLMVVPSVWPDPCPLTLTEAMACGVPVLASRIGGIPEVLTAAHAYGLFPAGDADQLADLIAENIDWRSRRPELGPGFRNTALERYSMDRFATDVNGWLAAAAGDRLAKGRAND